MKDNDLTTNGKQKNKSSEEKTIQLKKLLRDLIPSEDIDDDSILEAVTDSVHEMMDITLREPDPDFCFSEKEKKELNNIMMNTIQDVGSEKDAVISKALIPDLVKNLEYIMAKLRTLRL